MSVSSVRCKEVPCGTAHLEGVGGFLAPLPPLQLRSAARDFSIGTTYMTDVVPDHSDPPVDLSQTDISDPALLEGDLRRAAEDGAVELRGDGGRPLGHIEVGHAFQGVPGVDLLQEDAVISHKCV